MTGNRFDPARLMDWDIPEVRQSWGPQDNARYALSVGMSRDPMDRAELAYTAGVGGWRVLPGMALILGHPGFWVADPATGVDSVRVVHGEESFELLAPLPVSGEVIGKTRVIGLEDKGADKGALMFAEKTLTDATSGVVYAKVLRTSFLRGNGGFGGSYGRVLRAAPAPDGPADQIIEVETDPAQALLYRWNGDPNPLHFDPEMAAKAGFPRPILHGLCTMGIAAQIVMRHLLNWEDAAIKGLSARFSASVYPGERLAVDIWANGAFRVRVPGRDVIAVNNGMMRLD